MTKWKDIEKSNKYQKLSDTDRALIKGRFFWENINKSEKYTSLPVEQKNKIFNEYIYNRKYVTSFLKSSGKALFREFKGLPGIKHGDTVVEKVAGFIEPKVPPGRTTFGLMTKDLPRQITADFARAYKPSTLLPFMAGAKAIKPIIGPVGKAIWSKVPEKIKKTLTKEVTVGKGLPELYQKMLRKVKLDKAAGAREAEDVGKVLTLAPKDMTIKTPSGNQIVVKKGQPITREHQRYIGRIFRKEIDLGGKKSRLLEPEDVTRRITKNVEVEVGFNKKIQGLRKDLGQVNASLRNKELMAQGMIGKEFTTKTGFTEKVTGVTKTPLASRAGKESIDLVTEAVKPMPPTPAPIPANLAQEGEEIARAYQQVKQLPSAGKFVNKNAKRLLEKQKHLSRQIMKETMRVEEGVKANYYIFDRKYTEQLRTHPKYKELSAIASEGRVVMDKWSKELVKSGIPKEESSRIIQDNVGEYMARMYEKHLVKGISGYSPKNLRLRLDGLKHRKNLTAEVLRQLREIKEPALPTAIRVKEISASVANNKLFNAVAANPEWVATTNVTGTMVRMPKIKTLGALSDKFVVPEIANDVNSIISIKSANVALDIYGKALTAWKYGKVVLNPATHIRNMLSNSMLLDMSGVNHIRQMALMPKVMKDYLNKGPLYQSALKSGAIGGEFVGGEVALIEKFYMQGQGNNLSRWMNVLKSPLSKMGNIYQAEEQIAKMIKFADMLEKGKTASIAALESQKWLFNYEEIPNAIKVGKQLAPFITFTYKALPRVAETLVNNPLKLYKYYALSTAFNESSRKMLNMTSNEYAREKKALPPWLLKNIGGMPTNILMPWKDKYGRTQWLNLEYILPLGMAPEIMQRGLLKGGVSNPIVTLFADLSKNKDFKDQDIVPVGATGAEAAKITTEYVYRQLAPSLAPGLYNMDSGESLLKGGYSFDKIMSAIYKRPDYAERTRSITPVLFDVLMGLKLTPLYVKEAEMFDIFEKKKVIEDLNKQMLKLNHPAISPEFREKQTEKLFQKIQKTLED